MSLCSRKAFKHICLPKKTWRIGLIKNTLISFCWLFLRSLSRSGLFLLLPFITCHLPKYDHETDKWPNYTIVSLVLYLKTSKPIALLFTEWQQGDAADHSPGEHLHQGGPSQENQQQEQDGPTQQEEEEG